MSVFWMWHINEETKDDVGIEGEDRQVEEEGKLTKIIKKGKRIITNAYIVDISNENEITSLSQLYSQSAIKEEPDNVKIGINHVRAFEEQTKGFQRLEVCT